MAKDFKSKPPLTYSKCRFGIKQRIPRLLKSAIQEPFVRVSLYLTFVLLGLLYIFYRRNVLDARMRSVLGLSLYSPPGLAIALFVCVFVYLDLKRLANGIQCQTKKADVFSGSAIVITGASSGIGLSLLKQCIAWGASHIYVGVRNTDKMGEALKKVAQELYPNDQHKRDNLEVNVVKIFKLDLASLASVANFVKELTLKTQDIKMNYLVNNAGIGVFDSAHQLYDSNDCEIRFSTNFLGHYYLTDLLFDKIIKDSTTVINVSSLMHFFAGADKADSYFEFDRFKKPEDFDKNKQMYTKHSAAEFYGLSKLANVLHAKYLTLRFVENRHTSAIAVSVHPGCVSTGIWRYVPGLTKLMQFAMKDAHSGAQTILHLMTSEHKDIVKGGYYADCRLTSPSVESNDEIYMHQLIYTATQFVNKYLTANNIAIKPKIR